MARRTPTGRLFELLVADPTSADAPALAHAVIADLERRARPTAEERERLVDHAVLWWNLGFGPRARALLERWSRSDPRCRQLRHARARLALGSYAALDFDRERDAAALVTRLVLAGDPEAALAVARANHYFASRPDPVVMFVGWAFALAGRALEGERVVARWRSRAARDPEWLHHVLKAEALLALDASDFPREVQAFRAAHALALAHDLAMHRAAVELPLACALAHDGELAAARAIVAAWHPPGDPYVPLDAGRDLARAEVELLAGAWDAAEHAALRAAGYFETTELAVYACMARAIAALAAPAARFADALAAYRRAVSRVRIPPHRARLQLLERLAARGMTSFRELAVVERSRFAAHAVSPVRIAYPATTSLAAAVYWDQIERRLWLAGKGPFTLDEHPILAQTLDQLAHAPEQTLALPALFEAVWKMPYNPLVHESKLHVTLHRLRAWLDARAPGLGRIVVVRDGAVSIAGSASVIVLALPDEPAIERSAPRERVLDCLAAESPLTAAELERRVGVSRSTLHDVARALLDESAIARSGRGRALRYARITARTPHRG
ncbi:MAG: hypothetical protein ACM31C_10285 [Acidobacteriota bacterium]